ncbi:MAG TPA: ABC transporter ATP-binding protein [Kiloniellales bacterium]|jgi:branched-chain amino acid transport system ATP-binding protein|nr:ABC transporter ATP-binding protein [Kiloniellales bacterium]
MSRVLEVRGLAKAFGGVRAVRGVDLDLQAGEMLALIGPNGAGKSTCFNLINGQLQPDNGSVRFLGRDVVGLPPRRIWRLGVGRTFQVAATFASMSARENVQMAFLSHHRRLRRLVGYAGDAYKQEACDLLERVEMRALADRAAGVLAYGDVKRLELAMALAHGPRLLLMDEPTAGMAPQERRSLMTLTSEIVRKEGIAVLFTEHDMDAVFSHADRIAVLDRGEKIADGRPEEVRRDSRVQASYLGSFGAQS